MNLEDVVILTILSVSNELIIFFCSWLIKNFKVFVILKSKAVWNCQFDKRKTLWIGNREGLFNCEGKVSRLRWNCWWLNNSYILSVGCLCCTEENIATLVILLNESITRVKHLGGKWANTPSGERIYYTWYLNAWSCSRKTYHFNSSAIIWKSYCLAWKRLLTTYSFCIA